MVQAPMAGGATPPAFIVACMRHGLLGSLGAAYLSPEAMKAQVEEIAAATAAPLNINLFLPCGQPPAEGVVEGMLVHLAPLHEAAGLPPPHLPDPPEQDFTAQLAMLRRLRPRIASFVFGCPDAGMVAALKAEGILVIGAATHLEEARRVAASGVDAVVAQGGEAGAHRATFIGSFEDGLVPLRELLPQMVSALDIPVIAAGGLMSGGDIRAALEAGAALAQIGTALLRADECGIPQAHKDALAAGAAAGATTRLIRHWSGRAARGLANGFTRGIDAAGIAIPPFPLQNAMTQALRGHGRKTGDADMLALWCGTGYSGARAAPLADIVSRLCADAGFPSQNH
ncbi:hypothetical protein DKG74_18720 [Zavarzinia aquatilis]|uniref:Propionate 3-nitronate monooxygenase n=1 Tax=Zavarzinia aquatilis TaxID=2211142 RepID=A0A317DVV2_9PROT|nr:hypothetical protein DKG74_18720 [Zavarzinia aquatilis]